MSGKIVFFEGAHFEGRSYECAGDCSEIASRLGRCASCRVESGAFVVYDRPNYAGRQHLLTRGEYPECQSTIGFNDCIESCRLVPLLKGPSRMRIYERADFEGPMQEVTDDCDSILDRYHMSDVQSCNVVEGHWLMFERPHYEGRMFYLKPGKYRNLRETGGGDARFSSIRRIREP